MAPSWTATIAGRPPSFAKKSGKNAAKLASSQWVQDLQQRMQDEPVQTRGPVKVRIRVFLDSLGNKANPPDLDNLAKTILDVLSKASKGLHCLLEDDRNVEVLHVSREEAPGPEQTQITLSWS